jgi:hypothetical protein
MRPHIHGLSPVEHHWPHVIKKYKRTDGLQLLCGQGATHRKIAEITCAWNDDCRHRVV